MWGPWGAQTLSGVHTTRVLKESSYRPSSLCFSFLKWTHLRKSLWFFLPTSVQAETIHLPYTECFFGALPWGGKAPGVPDRGDRHGCSASAGQAVEARQRACQKKLTGEASSRPHARGPVPSLIWLSCWRDSQFIQDLQFRREMSHGWVSTHLFQLATIKPAF